MARLQILKLPAGAGDDRPSFAVIVDKVQGDGEIDPVADYSNVAKELGARAVMIFHDTVEIPANEPPPPADAAEAERAGVTQIVYAHERTRLDLCSALLLSGDTTWRNLVNLARGAREGRDVRAAALERVRGLPEQPAVMDAQYEQPQGYLHGYRVAIGDAKRAARTLRPEFGEAPE